MLYFGQDVGEDGSEETGFGDPTRTTIFDYAGVPAHQRWMNNGKFDGGQSSAEEKALRAYYERIMQISAEHPTMLGKYHSLHSFNVKSSENYSERQFAFVRYNESKALVIVSNFTEKKVNDLAIKLPLKLITEWQLNEGEISALDLMNGFEYQVAVGKKRSSAEINIELDALSSVVLEINLEAKK
jgi:hypothetical protein